MTDGNRRKRRNALTLIILINPISPINLINLINLINPKNLIFSLTAPTVLIVETKRFFIKNLVRTDRYYFI